MHNHDAPATAALLNLAHSHWVRLNEAAKSRLASLAVELAPEGHDAPFKLAMETAAVEASQAGLLIDLQPTLDELQVARDDLIKQSGDLQRVPVAAVVRINSAIDAVDAWLPALDRVRRNPQTMPDDLKRALGLAVRIYNAARHIFRKDQLVVIHRPWQSEARRLPAIYMVAKDLIQSLASELTRPGISVSFWRFPAPTAHEVVLRMAGEVVDTLSDVIASDDEQRLTMLADRLAGLVVATPWPTDEESSALLASLESEARDAARRRAEQAEQPGGKGQSAPVDETAFVPANRLWKGKYKYKKFKQILEGNSSIRTYNKGQRLFVHSGDWHKYLAQQDAKAFDALKAPAEAIDAFLDGTAERKAAIQLQKKRCGKQRK